MGIGDTVARDAEELRARFQLYTVLSKSLAAQVPDRRELLKYDRSVRSSLYLVSLMNCYGLIEKSVDDLLMNVARFYSRFYPSGDQLPEEIRENHRRLVLQCLIDSKSARTREKIDEQTALLTLSADRSGPVQLIPPAFTLTTRNYRHEYTVELFSRLKIHLAASNTTDKSDHLEAAGFKDYSSFLTDLIARRNDLAHSLSADDILDQKALGIYIEATVDYVIWLSRQVDRFYLDSLISKGRLTCIGKVAKVWQTAIGVEMTSGLLQPETIVVLVKNDWFSVQEIPSIQMNDTEVQEARGSASGTQVGIGISKMPQRCVNADVYSLPEPWEGYIDRDETAFQGGDRISATS